MLIKPEISKIMRAAAETPQDKEKSASDKAVEEAMLDVELTRELQKKERLQKLKEANEQEE